MRRMILSLLLLGLLLSTLLACQTSKGASVSAPVDLTPELKAQLQKGMTRREVFDLLGPYHSDTMSALYPFAPTWETEDGGLLTVVFYIDGCEDQAAYSELIEQLKEEGVLPVGSETTPEGFPIMDEEQMRVWKEWLDTNAKAVAAYLVKDKVKTPLF